MGRLAVEAGSWILYEIVNGQFEITYRPEERRPVREYLAPQKRFRHLDEELVEKIQNYVDAECKELGL
jgi:pyruvate ferredoxin oxidoreductase beta subunit